MSNLTPSVAIERLKEGNKRFVSGLRSVEPMFSHLKMKELAEKGQKPFAIVLTCSDSRSPVEMIFDQGIGDLFVVRVAGNVVAPSLLASIEFAAANFGSAALVVLGHTSCGAVNATVKHVQDPSVPLPSVHLEELISRIRPAVETALNEHKDKKCDLIHQSTLANIERSKKLILSQSEIVRNLYKSGKLAIESAILDISSGNVTFLNVT